MTNPTHDLQIDPATTRIAAFVAATRDVLAALSEGAEREAAVRIMVPHDGRWQMVAATEVVGAFLVRIDFAARGVVGRFVFGDRESTIALLLAPARHPALTYHLGEWVVALGSEPVPDAIFEWALTTRRVQEGVVRFGTLLLSHAARIADAKSETFAQMDAVRAIRFDEQVAAWRRRDQERDESAAADAFRAADYARVIDILAPYEAQLSAAQAMKLALARKRAMR